MAQVIFYEKPGCGGNARQKALLARAGHTLEVRNLLAALWTTDALRAFFGALPVAEWFNLSSPRVKSGEVVPQALDAAAALQLMLEDPLLIRRPLLEVAGERRVGFDAAAIERWIGLGGEVPAGIDGCAHGGDAPRCGPPGAEG